MTAALTESTAIRYCETVTRTEARNFWYGIRLLPATKRRLLAAVYAMARRIDDVADGDLPPLEKRAALTAIAASLETVESGSDDPVLAALHEGLGVCALPLPAFHDLIDGVCMDLDGVAYHSFDDLVPYCRRVAGSIGRLSLAVFRTGGGAGHGGARRPRRRPRRGPAAHQHPARRARRLRQRPHLPAARRSRALRRRTARAR